MRIRTSNQCIFNTTMNLHTQKGHIPENTVYVALQAVQMTLGVTEAIVD